MRPLFGRLNVLNHATCYGSFLLFLRLYFRDWNRFLLSVNATVGRDWHGLKLKKVGPTLLSFNLYLQIKITKNKIHCHCFLVKFVWYRFVNFLKKRYRVILSIGKRTKQWMSSAQNWPKTALPRRSAEIVRFEKLYWSFLTVNLNLHFWRFIRSLTLKLLTFLSSTFD